ncbi:MAG TPA: DNA-directed RNA polymerase subunit B [Candidatus Nanoarchaeia archaeon]|nr:DNA-directed RNA polymerase subunit B [Candidatus Nanoarchaeia archaeon]
MTDVFLNERFIGTVENAKEFIKQMRSERRKGILSSELNFHFDEDYDEIFLDTTKGRTRRPLIVVEGSKPKLTEKHVEEIKDGIIKWDKLVKDGIIEYVDAAEEEDCYVSLDEKSLTKEHTHLEISPVVILGLCTSLIPYSNFGGSSRLIRGSKIQKQSLGLYASNYLLRMDTDVNILHYPQKPITKTFMHDIYGWEKHPSGQNVVIALMSFEGYNMEDALIVSKASVDRGFARSTYFKPFSAEELRYQGGLVDEICLPDKEVKGYRSEKDYRLLEEDGVVYTGAKVQGDDVIIGRVSPPRFLGEFEEFNIATNVKRESSISLSHRDRGIVDMSIITESEEGNRLIQMRLREQRIPEVGDKFASRHGQKGVISYLVPYADMPFSANGIIPDVLFNPHGIPSRMTISHLIEIIAGKAGALAGKYIDGTAFDAMPEKELRKMLRELGFRDNGLETMYDGISGKQFTAKIYVGDMYYLKLKYMVANKLHARATGKIQLLTRQPIEGRSQGGGLRVGEMEKDCFVAHGASLLLKERFDSDKTLVFVCENCGMLGVYDSFKRIEYCTKCGSNVKISAVEMSYAFKLLLDELKSLGVYPKLILGRKF